MKLTDPDIRNQITPYRSIELITLECDECKNVINRAKKDIQNALNKGRLHSFCNKQCAGKYRHRQGTIKTNCTQCNTPIIKHRSDYRKTDNSFCSSKCSAVFNNTGVRRHGKAPSNCEQCGSKNNNSLARFCSRACNQDFNLKERINSGTFSAVVGKRWLLKTQGHQCSCCKNTEWNNQLIPIELDHIDGNHQNNTLENLRLLCPNCHAQTPTYKNSNKGNGRAYRRQRYAEGKSY